MAGSPKTKEDYEEIYKPVVGSEKELNPIIFLHAMLCSKEIWTDIPQRVADATKRTVYAYDARHHGALKEADGEFSFEKLVEDLFGYMAKKNIKKAILVGHSMGGKTAISAALQDGDRVGMVFTVDMYVKKIPDVLVQRSIKFIDIWSKVVKELKDTSKDEITKKSVPELYKRLSEELEMDPEIKESEERAYLKSNFVYTTTDGKHDVSYNTSELTKALNKYIADAKEMTGEYKGPAYFLYGTKSPYEVGKEEGNIKASFPNVEMIEFENAPHHIFVHAPELFVTTLVDRINRASS